MTEQPIIGYADCFSGISGDMFLGALLHCGLPRQTLLETVSQLDIGEVDIDIRPWKSCGIGACKVDIHAQADQRLRHLPAILEILEKSGLDDDIISTSTRVFKELARAEAKVHDIEIERVHFHEVGAVDTIIDVVGTVAGLKYLGIGRLVAAPLPSPRGFVRCAHGDLPLPAPAVCEILRGVPCYGVDIDKELVTPTGAALVKVLADNFGPMPPMIINTTGYGSGSAELPGNRPNLFRLIIGEDIQVEEVQEVEVIETNIDDWSPEGFPHLCELLLNGGALDVSLAPIQMKKGRPGFKLEVIAPLALALPLRHIIFRETTAIGMRHHREHRQTLPRETVVVETRWGPLTAKKVVTPDGETVYPEYEECRRIALENGVALTKVYDAVKHGSSNREGCQ